MSHQKEIAKYLKLISAKKLDKNHKECIELYNLVGGLYTEIGSYDEAAHYHEQALELCKTIGDRLGTAVAFRFIGEAKAATGNFAQATEFTKKYLELAQKLNNKVEIQRAWTTLGRVYLMRAQELKDKNNVIDKDTKEAAREADKKFQTALSLAESVRDQVDDKEYAQMISGLLTNIGLIKDICGQHNEAVAKFNRAMETCRAAKLKEDLYRCQIILAGIYRQRNEVKMAVKTSEEALQTAKSIGKKILIVEALIERGMVRLCQRDFKNAKRTFAQAYVEKSPSEEDHSKAIRLTKLAYLITSTYEKLCKDTTASDSRAKLCDKLGDLFVAIGNFKLAVEFYRRAYADAKVCSKSKPELARILYSIAETYADDGQFAHALLCYEKELAYRGAENTGQCQSLIKIAHMHEYLEHEPAKVSEAYEKALEKADKDPKLMYSVLRYYVPYLRQHSTLANRYRELNEKLKNLKSYPEVIEDIEGEDNEESNDLEDEVANVDDVITDDEDNDEVLMVGRRRSKGGKKFKPNEVGDTPLHEASIKGDLKRVKSLVAQGHDINPRDNAGWIPLHEACNHGHHEIAEFLIEHGADVNNRGLSGMSPLHDAATNGHFDIMRLLIKNGANVISLTDCGSTVLSCLRDYKVRYAHKITNEKMTEYKQVEAELLNAMDKCGYNLMSENMKNLGTRAGNSRRTDNAHLTQQESQTPAPQHRKLKFREPVVEQAHASSSSSSARPAAANREALKEAKPDANSVREYREAITTLKRKRPLEVTQPSKRGTQPATVETDISTSVSTKDWLLSDDVIEEEDEDDDDDDDDDVVEVPAAKTIRGRPKTILEEDEDENDGDDDDDVVVVAEKDTKTDEPKAGPSHEKSSTSSSLDLPELLTSQESPERDHLPVSAMEDWDDESFSPQPGTSAAATAAETAAAGNLIDNIAKDTTRNSRSKSPNSIEHFRFANSNCSSTFDLFSRPLTITIQGRKLLIPVKEEYTTVGELKRTIVERYSVLVNAKPTISLAPASEPECYLFDHDLCRDVIRENLVATVDSWQLESIEATYLSECRAQQVEQLNFVKLEMRDLDEKESQGRLNLAFLKFPRRHLRPIMKALARRHFTCANFQGSNLWFECQRLSQELLGSTLFTWNKLTRLNLKCAGLLRFHFELLCNSKEQLPELQQIDVSVNSIAYKKKSDFTTAVEKLRLVCGGGSGSGCSLKRLDVRKNHLLFVKSLTSDSSSSSSAATAEQGNKTTTDSTAENDNSQEDKAPLNISELLNLRDIEILACDQYEYSVYLMDA